VVHFREVGAELITPVQRWVHPGRDVQRLPVRLEQLIWFFASPPVGRSAPAPSSVDELEANRPNFETFVRQYEYDIFTYLWRMTGDVETAYDLRQEAFLRAWQHYEKISQYTEPKAWLFRVATNLAINHRTRHGRGDKTPTASELSEQPDISVPAVDHVVDQNDVRMVLLAIPSKLRAVLVLHDAYGFTSAEIAAILHITVSATKMRLCRGRDEFRARYMSQEGQ
jgi:RNA polymerase sigma-70 factor (ECF subfamily)